MYVVYLVAYAVIKKLSIGTFSALFNYTDVVYTSGVNTFNSVSLLSNYLEYASKYFEFIHHEGFGDISHGYVKLS
jgi:hypothetical protein